MEITLNRDLLSDVGSKNVTHIVVESILLGVLLMIYLLIRWSLADLK